MANSSVEVITNRHHYELVSWRDLPEKWQREHDYLNDESQDQYSPRFVLYRKWCYDVFDCMSTSGMKEAPYVNWDCYQSETFFSGVLFKLVEEGEAVICGHYYVKDAD